MIQNTELNTKRKWQVNWRQGDKNSESSGVKENQGMERLLVLLGTGICYVLSWEAHMHAWMLMKTSWQRGNGNAEARRENQWSKHLEWILQHGIHTNEVTDIGEEYKQFFHQNRKGRVQRHAGLAMGLGTCLVFIILLENGTVTQPLKIKAEKYSKKDWQNIV